MCQANIDPEPCGSEINQIQHDEDTQTQDHMSRCPGNELAMVLDHHYERANDPPGKEYLHLLPPSRSGMGEGGGSTEGTLHILPICS